MSACVGGCGRDGLPEYRGICEPCLRAALARRRGRNRQTRDELLMSMGGDPVDDEQIKARRRRRRGDRVNSKFADLAQVGSVRGGRPS